MTVCWHFNWKPRGLISNREQIHQQQTYGYITVLNVPVAWKLDLCIGVSCTYKVFYSEQQLQQWHLLNKSINILLNERLELLALAVIEKLYITNSYLHTHLNMVSFFCTPSTTRCMCFICTETSRAGKWSQTLQFLEWPLEVKSKSISKDADELNSVIFHQHLWKAH